MITATQTKTAEASRPTRPKQLKQSPDPIRIDGSAFYTVVSDICALADLNLTRTEYFTRCFRVLCEYFGAETGLINVRQGARTLERSFTRDETCSERWIDQLDELLLRAQTDERAVSRKFQLPTTVPANNPTIAAYALASPIVSNSGHTFGAIGLIFNCNTHRSNFEAHLAQLNQLLELIVENAPFHTAPAENKGSDSLELKSVVRASDYRTIHHLCFAIANSLCGKLRCEQIVIGLVRKREVRLISVSGLSEVPRDTPGMTAVRQAMNVCLDRNRPTVSQENGKLIDQCESSPCKVHQIWRTIAGGSSVATLPLQIDGECVAVIALRRMAHEPFCPDDLKRARILAESFAPALPLVDRASRSVARHVLDSLSQKSRAWFAWKGLGRKAVALSLFFAAMWMILGKTEYRVTAPCKIVAESVFNVASPFEGMIRDVLVKPGQRVVAGQTLIQIDTRDLATDRNRVRTQIIANQIESNGLLQQRQPQEAFLIQAKTKVLQTELQLIAARIERAQICAPSDGVVMPTEIHRRIGQHVSLGEPLLQIADESKCHLEIETPVQDAQFVQIDQAAFFLTNARPDQHLPCHIARISPSSEIVRDKNVVVTEAVLDSREEWMKIGTEGHIRIETGKQPVWWVHLHPVLNYVRLKLWL